MAATFGFPTKLKDGPLVPQTDCAKKHNLNPTYYDRSCTLLESAGNIRTAPSQTLKQNLKPKKLDPESQPLRVQHALDFPPPSQKPLSQARRCRATLAHPTCCGRGLFLEILHSPNFQVSQRSQFTQEKPDRGF